MGPNPRTRGPVVEAHAERQQDVGLARRVVCLVVAAARHQPQRQGMMGVNGAEAAGRCGHRNLQAFGEPQQFSAGASPTHALPDNNHGPLGGKEHVDGLDHAFRIGAATARNVGVPFFRFRRLLGGFFHEHIERHVKHHRPRPSGHHGLPRLAHCERHHLAARRLEHPLAIGAHGRREVRLIVAVQFLEGAAIELTGRDITGHRHERYRVEEGIGERDRQVGRAGAARSKSRGWLAGHAIVHVGHEACDALVAHRDGLDVVLALVQSVDELDIAVTTKAEDTGYLLPDQIVDDDLSSVELLVDISVSWKTRRNTAEGGRGRRKLFVVTLCVN
jgi:hypothetical protein